ncbi:STAS domain-containing protein [Actinosynnema sp. NPDC053489]|uniref:STAS domain-containing protein n=1 Tax=Actinosynnema sp. NPDC053489 TaxID=3363916 RepID=UPI0037CAAEB6
MPQHTFFVRSEVLGDISVVTVTGELDADPALTMQAEVVARLDEGNPVIVDLSGLTFFASSGINALLALHRHARAKGVDVVVVAAQRLVLRPLTVTGTVGVLGVHPTVADALAALRPDHPRRTDPGPRA